jgi:P4 family phage/plasmid primase-like protien
MSKILKSYRDKNLVFFSVDIKQKLNKENLWKKEIKFPKEWQNFTLNNTIIRKDTNAFAFLTGKINNFIVIDIDNVEHWQSLLQKHKQIEPDTVKARSGSGGIHYYFEYEDDFDVLQSNTKCFGKDYDIDIRTNGGCIICPPSKYHNKNSNKESEYVWEKNITENKIEKMPDWMKNLLLKNKIKNNKKDREKNKKKDCDYEIIELENKEKEEEKEEEKDKEDKEDNLDTDNIIFSEEDIEFLIDLLSVKRCDNYDNWITLGMILYNIDKEYKYVWRKWSKKSSKYEDGVCEEKWKSFKKNKDGVSIGTLLLWCKEDNKEKYKEFIKKKKFGNMILQKYPNDKLILGETIMVNDKCNYTNIKSNICLIKGDEHKDMPDSMYVEILDKFMTIKCKHNECFGKTYPCNHILMNKNEMNIAFNGNVNITINNNYKDDEFVEFQQIEIYDDPNLNELVYNSLNGESYPCAKIGYYFYKDRFIYAEDKNWYFYENHKWKNIGDKNMELRDMIQSKLKDLYNTLYKYYKDNTDKQKIKSLKNIMKSFDNTTLKNNIMTELMEIYTINKNPKRDFTKKLDSNNNLIGFNNGVYDLQKFEFREGEPDDYITLTAGYDYTDKHTEKYDDLLKFLQDIQPNKEERDYMITYISIGLFGNLLELFTILTGCGRNGKSKLIELLGKTFGDYYGSVQSQMFTRPRPDANSPDPGLLSLSKKRIVIASEPEKNSKLNSGFIKFITGRDSTTLRNCHSNDMIDFSPKFLTLLICNDIPDTDDIDNAFSKRLRCINFPTEFVPEPKKDNQKKMDVNINKNFDYWKLDFLLLLIEHYKKYTETNELKSTDNILKWTNQYKEDTDLYLQFLNECTEESTTHAKTTDIYERFKNWFKNNNPNTKIPSNKEFVANIKKHKIVEHVKINKTSSYGIKNLKLIDVEDDE